ncbi:hypothetical protein EF917_19555 [Streptomyces sp. WAC00469]|nr:hypothetical protein EF917_19555 [Streptomyces sp. WAC00469]
MPAEELVEALHVTQRREARRAPGSAGGPIRVRRSYSARWRRPPAARPRAGASGRHGVRDAA